MRWITINLWTVAMPSPAADAVPPKRCASYFNRTMINFVVVGVHKCFTTQYTPQPIKKTIAKPICVCDFRVSLSP
jgi:hypothetical protein